MIFRLVRTPAQVFVKAFGNRERTSAKRRASRISLYHTGRRPLSSFLTLYLSLMLLSTGCATPASQSFHSALSEETRRAVRSIAVVPSEEAATSNFLTFAKSRNIGAAKGAGTGALEGALYFSAETVKHDAGPYAALLLPFMAAAGAVIGGITGGIHGAVTAIPADEAQKIDTAIERVLAGMDVQGRFASHVAAKAAALTDYAASLRIRAESPKRDGQMPPGESSTAPDILLNVGVRELGFKGGEGRDPAVSFFMDANVRVVRASDGQVLFFGPSQYSSRPISFSSWAGNDAANLRREFETAFENIATQVVENLFLVYDFHVDSIWSTDMYCMMKPIYPPLKPLGFFSRERMPATVSSRRPTFQWESFPRDKDKTSDVQGVLSGLTDVTYDLRIWKVSTKNPGDLIYERRGLRGGSAVTEHAIEAPLAPATEYFWSVRARFMLNGKPRMTRWSCSRIPWYPQQPDPCREDHIPLSNYHRFAAP